MKLFTNLLVVLLSLLLIIILAAWIDPIEATTGIPHPEYNGMFVAPDTIDQHSHTKWLGYLFGLGILALFTLMLLIGNRKRGKVTTIGRWIVGGMILYVIAYTFMVLSNWNYLSEEVDSFIGSMPAPTAWMIYVVWFIPLVITISYILKFEEAIISEEEIEAFHEFLKENQT